MSGSSTSATFRAGLALAVMAGLGCSEPSVRAVSHQPMAVYLAIHSRLEGSSPVQVAVGRSRLWNAPAPAPDAAAPRPAGGHFRVTADTVRVIAVLDDGTPCRRKAALESRREAWLDVILEPTDCTIRIRYAVPAVPPDSAPRLPSQIMFIALASMRGAAGAIPGAGINS